MMGFAAGLVLAGGAALSPAQGAAIDAAVAAIYRPYRADPSNPTAVWERPVWTAPVRALIAEWQTVVPENEVDELNDGDWLCQCQDFDSQKFTATVLSKRPLGPARVEATVRVNLGFGEPRTSRLTLRREGGEWKIDEMVSESYPHGLRQAIRETIAADRKLRR